MEFSDGRHLLPAGEPAVEDHGVWAVIAGEPVGPKPEYAERWRRLGVEALLGAIGMVVALVSILLVAGLLAPGS